MRTAGFPGEWLDAGLDALQPLIANRLVRTGHDVITVPEHAPNLVRSVASVFDAYLDPAAGRHAAAV
jgi:oxygen-independent coproporphyrinogen III oxidase